MELFAIFFWTGGKFEQACPVTSGPRENTSRRSRRHSSPTLPPALCRRRPLFSSLQKHAIRFRQRQLQHWYSHFLKWSQCIWFCITVSWHWWVCRLWCDKSPLICCQIIPPPPTCIHTECVCWCVWVCFEIQFFLLNYRISGVTARKTVTIGSCFSCLNSPSVFCCFFPSCPLHLANWRLFSDRCNYCLR